MPLSAGTRLGHYEVVASLGAGGMGEVYRARDARLARDVALKVLPVSVAGNAERLKRFEKEARAASALNHPNLVTIHDIGSSNGIEFIAMELVEGRTLREILVDGAVPAKTVLGIAAQAADGLAKAHGIGIVHRDLKPENLMVSRDGFVKILDFGLAKLTEPEEGSGRTAAPTVSGATEPGVVMGTVGYMSPEQALGRPVDFRSDQFSFGSILYEMATGKRAFSRDSAPETLSAIIRDEPEPIGRLAPLSPAPLSWIVERCLAKNADDRYASTRDLARDLSTLRDRLGEASSGAALAGSPAAHRASKGWLPWVVAATLAAAAVALWIGRRPAPSPQPVVRFSIGLPAGVSFENGEIEGQHAVSPDGRKVVFVGGAQAQRKLYLRSLDSLETRPLEGTDGGISPFWSPDSRSLGFFADGKVQRLDFSGPPRIICEAPFLESLPSWGSAGEILFATLGPDNPGIYAVSASGGQPRPIISRELKGSVGIGIFATFLPDGKRFLFLTRDFDAQEDRRWRLTAGSIDSPETTEISDAIWSRVEYAAPGHLVYVRQGVLMAQPFDLERLRFSGEAVPLADRVYYFNGPAQAGFSASQAGVVTYEKLALPSRVAWLDRGGRELERLPLEGIVATVRLSPDGRTVAANVRDEKLGTHDLWLFDLSRRLPARLTHDIGDDQAPVWSADGAQIYFRGDRFGPPDIWAIPVSTPGRDVLLFRRPGVQHPEDASPDGRFLVLTEWNRKTDGDIWLQPLSEGAEPTPLETGPYYEAGARFSPDGRFLAYVSGESGALEIYVRPLESRGERVRVSARGGRMPRWRRDGKELFYVALNGDIVAVSMRSGGSPDPGAPSVLFRLDGELRDFEVEATGQRFLVDLADHEPSPIGVIVNWPTLARPGRVH